ncbi:hypothetical protein QNH16_08900 [Peribacillus frigoritolerans]|uniref:hypothetical protein n=1 Tax=Peribacillus frigoritolerans TaxID=450367 RepID=UPI0024C05E4E|nr:hypothetical protein [Peribacillus frigoritolerans]WHY15739.1 hypothetical protein QNH16_08900 [Peribacillus frigoritolerans]
MDKFQYSLRDYIFAIIVLVLPCCFIFGVAIFSYLSFILFLAVIFLYLGININYLLSKIKTPPPSPLYAFYRLVSFLMTIYCFIFFMSEVYTSEIIFLSDFAKKFSNVISYFAIFCTIGIFIWFLFEVVFGLYKYIKEPVKINNKRERFEAVFILIMSLLTTLVLPDVIFGILYSFSLSLIDTKILEMRNSILEFTYISFVIHYGLPLNSETIQAYIKLINEHTLNRLIQLLHVSICKFLDLTFVAMSINYFLSFLNSFNNSKNKNAS